ncbi:MAG: ATP-binding cassette domain-containing protein [Mediterraneibacter gnavus]
MKIEEGKITTILGANGCGKSTLFSLMTKTSIPEKEIFFSMEKRFKIELEEFAMESSDRAAVQHVK